MGCHRGNGGIERYGHHRIATGQVTRAPPAVINAIVDALKDYGVRHMNMPATSGKIWSIINAGPAKMAAD